MLIFRWSLKSCQLICDLKKSQFTKIQDGAQNLQQKPETNVRKDPKYN
jgi:hypothetical protein